MIHHSTKKRFQPVVSALLEWHRENQRSFIWRGLERSSYVVLVSEFMLQQTGAKQVEKRLPEFLRKFPTINRLANASQPEVVRAWHGLGYNRRAINLHHAAKAIASAGAFPETLETLRALPGVGLYTASAVLAFAHNADTPVVDVNIERVLSRLWKQMPNAHATLPMREIYDLDKTILPSGKSASWHEALMDLGSTICTKNSPKCGICPVKKFCPSARKVWLPVTKKTNLSEKTFFGQPRRIWRGRILREVSKTEPAHAKTLAKNLAQRYKIKDTSFIHFVFSVLADLTKEGFLTQTSKGAFRLADHK